VKWQLLVASLMLGLAIPAISSETVEPVSVDRLCGQLVSSADTKEQGKANSSPQEVKPVSHARIRLFSPTASGDCCTLMTPMAETLSGRDGIFQFKKITPGDYLIVATLAGNDYKLLVRYEPVKTSEKNCSELQYTVEKGKFFLRRSAAVSVDR
jgi:hypothetical protein